MVLGFSGWMDGGEVSTGTIETLAEKLSAQPLAEIECEDLYIFSFPGSMEVSALFRPYTKIEEGLITDYQTPSNKFFYSENDNLILFKGKEPSFQWSEYCECILTVAQRFDVSMIYFIGTVAGLVPHTREPRLFSSVSDESLKPAMEQLGLRFSNYEGPASVVTYLMRMASKRKIPMASLVAEIPAYVQGRNYRCIESVTRTLSGMLKLQLELDDLRSLGDHLEQRLDEIVKDHPELLERISRTGWKNAESASINRSRAPRQSVINSSGQIPLALRCIRSGVEHW